MWLIGKSVIEMTRFCNGLADPKGFSSVINLHSNQTLRVLARTSYLLNDYLIFTFSGVRG